MATATKKKPAKKAATKAIAPTKALQKIIADLSPKPVFTQDEIDCCEDFWITQKFWFDIWKWNIETGEIALVECIGVDEFEDVYDHIQARYDWHPDMNLEDVIFMPWPKALPTPLQGIAKTAARMKKHCERSLEGFLLFRQLEERSK